MNYNLRYLEEPNLEFRFGQKLSTPHDGLTLFGPYSADSNYHKSILSYAVIGTELGQSMFSDFICLLQKAIISDLDVRIWPNYPGFEEVTNTRIPRTPTHKVNLDNTELDSVLRNVNGYLRVGKAVDMYLGALGTIATNDEPIDIVYCIVPDHLFSVCRPQSKVNDGSGFLPSTREVRQKIAGQLSWFDDDDDLDYYQYSTDFRRQLKARAMALNIPIQIMRESSLVPYPGIDERKLTPLSDRAWNLSVASYYKIGGKPWCLSDIRDGVCYIGIAYKLLDTNSHQKTACVAAQMFLRDGDGIVFRGETGKWYSPRDKEFHLTKQKARDLIQGVIRTYLSLGGKQLTEVFIHSHSSINRDEYDGFAEACPAGVRAVAIRVRQDYRGGIRLYRRGIYPVLRGVYMVLNNRQSLLWTTGYKPRLGSYDGCETPVPLSIDLQHGHACIDDVTRDIFSLTKLNFNTCKIGMSEPVTVGFSKMVGEILVSHKADIKESPNFKFYM